MIKLNTDMREVKAATVLLVIWLLCFGGSLVYVNLESQPKEPPKKPCEPTGYTLLGDGKAITDPCGDTIPKNHYRPIDKKQ